MVICICFKRCVVINKSKELWLSGIALKLYSTGQVYQVTVHGTAAYLSIELVSVALVLFNCTMSYFERQTRSVNNSSFFFFKLHYKHFGTLYQKLARKCC